MQWRTFFRIMVDNLFVNNPIAKSIGVLVNFCNNSTLYNKNELKFSKKMPLNKIERKSVYDKRFVFNSSYMYGVDSE